MTFNQQNIKPYKGKFVKIKFGDNEITSTINGTINGNHKRFIIFNVNKTGYEIKINYDKIKSVEQIKKQKK